MNNPGDGAGGQAYAQLEELDLDPAVAPPRVLIGQTHDEVDRGLFNRRSTCSAVRIGPAPSDQPPVPSEHGFGRDAQTCPLRAREQPTERCE